MYGNDLRANWILVNIEWLLALFSQSKKMDRNFAHIISSFQRLLEDHLLNNIGVWYINFSSPNHLDITCCKPSSDGLSMKFVCNPTFRRPDMTGAPQLTSPFPEEYETTSDKNLNTTNKLNTDRFNLTWLDSVQLDLSSSSPCISLLLVSTNWLNSIFSRLGLHI